MRNLILNPQFARFVLVLAGTSIAATTGCGQSATVAPMPPAAAQPGFPAATASPSGAAANPAESVAVAEPTAPEPPRTPATVAEAKAAFDLETFPLYEGADKPSQQCVGGLSYLAKGKTADVYAFLKAQFLKHGFKELPGGFESAESANGTFKKDGFVASASVSNYASNEDPGKVFVYVTNHGNVDPGRLPLPSGTTVVYAGPVTAMHTASGTPEETASAIRKLFLDQGWVSYGMAGDSQIFKQNAIRVTASVGPAPAQGGKTMISYMSEQLSADIPGPTDMIDARYSDSTKQLSFDSAESQDAIFKYYVDTLGAAGWQPTTDKPLEIDWKKVLIFRNEPMDLIEVELTEVDGKTRASVEHQSAAEVAEMDRLIKEEQERLTKAAQEEANRPAAKFTFTLPKGAESIEADANEIKFNVNAGKAGTAFDAIRKQLTDAGWKEDLRTRDANLGNTAFSKDAMSIDVTYVETGILPSEISITGFGVELERAE
jgi:hypothetical protein